MCANDIHDLQVVDFVVVWMFHVKKPDSETDTKHV